MDPSLICPICFDVLRDAVSVCEEGHVYCKDCVTDLARDLTPQRCPECRRAITSKHKVRAVIRTVEGLITKCKYKNCHWTGSLVEREGHIVRCYNDTCREMARLGSLLDDATATDTAVAGNLVSSILECWTTLGIRDVVYEHDEEDDNQVPLPNFTVNVGVFPDFGAITVRLCPHESWQDARKRIIETARDARVHIQWNRYVDV